MEALYTILAAFVVTAGTNFVKWVGGFINEKIKPKLPGWVLDLVPLWKLFAALVIAVGVYLIANRFAVELQHPLIILVIAQVTHEVTDAVRKARKNNENDPS